MGVEPAIRAACTGEEGTVFVESNDKVVASFPVGMGPTNEFEIVRHRLAKVFYDDTKDGCDYRFGESIMGIDQSSTEEAVVTFSSGKKEAFEVVVLADGLGSYSRSLAFDKANVIFNPLNTFSAYFSIPFEPEDGPWSRLWVDTHRRSIWMRPAPPAAPEPPATLAALLLADPEPELRARLTGPEAPTTAEGRKALWDELFRGRGWKTDRILEGMDKAEDFHVQVTSQVKIAKWYRGRVALVGDAAYCPSPMTGMGTSCAITGAFTLGQELAKAPSSLLDLQQLTAAFSSYDTIVLPYVESIRAQVPPPTLLKITFPLGRAGLAFLHAFLKVGAFFANSKWLKAYAERWQQDGDEKVKLGEDGVVRSTVV